MTLQGSKFLVCFLFARALSQSLQCVDPDTKQLFNNGDTWEKNCWIYICSAGSSNWRITVDGRAASCIGSARDEGSSLPGQRPDTSKCIESDSGKTFVDGETWFKDCWHYICSVNPNGSWTLSPTHRVTGNCNSRCFNGDCSALKCTEPETDKQFLNGQSWSRNGFNYICKSSETGWTITPTGETSTKTVNSEFTDPETKKTHKNGDVFKKDGWNFQCIFEKSGWQIRPLSEIKSSVTSSKSSSSASSSILIQPTFIQPPVVKTASDGGTIKCTDKDTGKQYSNGETFAKGVWKYKCSTFSLSWKISPVELMNNPTVLLGSGIIASTKDSKTMKCTDAKTGTQYRNGETFEENGQRYKCTTTSDSWSLDPISSISSTNSHVQSPSVVDTSEVDVRKCRDRDTKMEYADGDTYEKDGWRFRCIVDADGWRIEPVGEASNTSSQSNPSGSSSASKTTSSDGCLDFVDGQNYAHGATWTRSGVTYKCTVLPEGRGFKIDPI